MVKKVRRCAPAVATRMMAGDGIYIIMETGKNHDANVEALRREFFFDYDQAMDEDSDVHVLCTPYRPRMYEMEQDIKAGIKFFKKTINAPFILIEMTVLKSTGPNLWLPAFRTAEDLGLFRSITDANYRTCGWSRRRNGRVGGQVGTGNASGMITMLDMVVFHKNMG
jgi:hypothetical protein